MKINYVTTNKLKFAIAERFFANNSEYELVQISQETPEIQAASCEEIAAFSAQHIAKEIGEPCVVMDAGFFIPALGGFPGPFVKQVNNWLSEEQILRMLTADDDRSIYLSTQWLLGFPTVRCKHFRTKPTAHSLALANILHLIGLRTRCLFQMAIPYHLAQ